VIAPEVTLALTTWQARPEWLRAAAAEALAQTGCDFELIVVDDGSEPAAATLLAELEDPRLRHLRLEHGGIAAARNAAVAAMRGRYVRFLDDDDGFPPDGTRRLLEGAQGRDDVLVYGRTVVCDEALRPRWTMHARQEGDVTVASLLARFNVRPGGILWPRAVFATAGGFDPDIPVSEDWEMLQRALEHVEVRRVDAPVHLYRRHGHARTRDHRAGLRSARLIVERYFERHPEQRGTRLERRAQAMLEAVAARVLATRGEPREALRHASRAVRLDPLAFAHESRQAASALRGWIAGRAPVAA
jgi:glycosyltransferase involved in cell wall biosynthesis